VVAPPYDVISPAERLELELRSPHNVVRLILPEGEGDAKYGNAARTLRTWLAALTKPAGLRAETRTIIVEAVERLQALLAAFDAAGAQEPRSPSHCRSSACRSAPALRERMRAAVRRACSRRFSCFLTAAFFGPLLAYSRDWD